MHPDLIFWLDHTLYRSPYDFGAYDGPRDSEAQALKVASGASDTMDSRHIVDDFGIHYAADLLPYPFTTGKERHSWDPKYYVAIMREGFQVSAEFGIPVDWGGWWTGTSFGKDYAHIALHRRFYPPNRQVSTWQSRAEAGIKWTCDPQTGKPLGQEFIARSA